MRKILEKYRPRIEEMLFSELQAFQNQGKLGEACCYALESGGKRFRPLLVFMMADALGKGEVPSSAAFATESFHTASLIADDLPCMDDDDERRGKPSLHVKEGEGVALLASYALIAHGYGCLAKGALGAGLTPSACRLAVEAASATTGLAGATGGQFLDLYSTDLSEEVVEKTFYQKTASLFELSFVLGWLYGGGDPAALEEVKTCAYHFGIAFQVADDLGDQEQDRKNGRALNFANLFGEERAIERLCVAQEAYAASFAALSIDAEEFLGLGKAVVSRAL